MRRTPAKWPLEEVSAEVRPPLPQPPKSSLFPNFCLFNFCQVKIGVQVLLQWLCRVRVVCVCVCVRARPCACACAQGGAGGWQVEG
jgi:hypothetical protein